MDDQAKSRAGTGLRYRKLRIAWSVIWGILGLLVVALWVRSYFFVHCLSFMENNFSGNIASDLGDLSGNLYIGKVGGASRWELWGYGVSERVLAKAGERSWVWQRFEWQMAPEGFSFRVPHWILVGLSAAIATIPWLGQSPYQFSLRTLLMAMTVVAVGLGAIVYSMR
jgi:hypothetical protein